MAARKKAAEPANLKRGRGRPPKGESVNILREQIVAAQEELAQVKADLATAIAAQDRLGDVISAVRDVSRLVTAAGRISAAPRRRSRR